MKLSVSLPDDDVATLDAFARAAGLGSRSAALQQAIKLLRQRNLSAEYEQAWQEWAASGEAEAWSGETGDGLGRAAR